MRTLSRLQYHPPTGQVLLLVVLAQRGNDLVRNVFEVAGSEGQDRRPSSGEAHPQKAGFCLGGHGLDDFRQPGYQRLSVGLVDLVLHGEVNELWVGR